MTKEFHEVCFTYKIELSFKEARKTLIKGLRDVEWYIDLKKKQEHTRKSISEEEAEINRANAKGAKVTASKAQKALEGYREQYAEATEKLEACSVSKGRACPENFWFALRIDPERQVQPAFPDCFNMPCADNEIRMLLTIRSHARADVQTLVWSLVEEDGSTFLEINSDNNLADSLHLSTKRICDYLVDYAYNQTANEKKAIRASGSNIYLSAEEETALKEELEAIRKRQGQIGKIVAIAILAIVLILSIIYVLQAILTMPHRF